MKEGKIIRAIRGRAVNDLLDEAEEGGHKGMKEAIKFVNNQGIMSGYYVACAVFGGTVLTTYIGLKIVDRVMEARRDSEE